MSSARDPMRDRMSAKARVDALRSLDAIHRDACAARAKVERIADQAYQAFLRGEFDLADELVGARRQAEEEEIRFLSELHRRM